MIGRLSACAVVLASIFSVRLHAQSSPYPTPDIKELYGNLLSAIEQIPIFDNHSHPGFADDPDVDAMAAPPGSAALRIRPDNPELIAASKALFQYPYSDYSPEHTRWLIDRKAQLRREQGNQYFGHILDRLGIETAIANRVSMPGYLDRKRFLSR